MLVRLPALGTDPSVRTIVGPVRNIFDRYKKFSRHYEMTVFEDRNEVFGAATMYLETLRKTEKGGGTNAVPLQHRYGTNVAGNEGGLPPKRRLGISKI